MLSNQIFYLRKLKKISQAQLAKAIYVSPSTLGMYEQGRREPSIDTLVLIADYFNVSLDYLINGNEFIHKAIQDNNRNDDTYQCGCQSQNNIKDNT